MFADAARKRLGALGERINAGFTRNAFELHAVPAPGPRLSVLPRQPRARAARPSRCRTFVAATFVGIIPGTFVFVNLGETLGRIDSLRGLVSWPTLGAFALLGLLALVPIAVRRWRARRVTFS